MKKNDLKAAREVRTYGYDIPKFGYRSSFIVVFSIMLTMFFPMLATSLGIDPKMFTMLASSIIITLTVFFSQYVFEKRRNITLITYLGYTALFLSVMMIYYFWIFENLPI